MILSNLRWLTDEDFDNRILRGLLRREPDLPITRVQDVGLAGTDDTVILEWAAQNIHVLLTHDQRTIPRHVTTRIKQGKSVTGVVVVPQTFPIGKAIDEILLINACLSPEEMENIIYRLPL